jgi:tetratricopeptide (TPR) repeat protein
MRSKRYDAAIADFNKAMHLEPGEAPSYLADRGDAYLQKGDLDRAITDFSRAIGMRAETAEAYFGRAMPCASSLTASTRPPKAVAPPNRREDAGARVPKCGHVMLRCRLNEEGLDDAAAGNTVRLG